MAETPYDTLAEAYDWLVPEPLLRPEGAVNAFAGVIDALDPAPRSWTARQGPGSSRWGSPSGASTSSPPTRAPRWWSGRGGSPGSAASSWPRSSAGGTSSAAGVAGPVRDGSVLQLLTHAGGPAARRVALRQMTGVLRPGGLLVLTSRNWEQVRERGPGLAVADRLVVREGRRGLVVHGWTIAADGHATHLDVAGPAHSTGPGPCGPTPSGSPSGRFVTRPSTRTCAGPASPRSARPMRPTPSAIR